MKGLWIFSVVAMVSAGALGANLVHAEGRAVSNVGEHVARRLARSRAFDSARRQCRSFGFKGEPKVVPNSGYDTAHATGNHWRAHYFADFECSNAPAAPVNYGPWLNLDESLSFQVLPQRHSWWVAGRECAKLGRRLPTWSEISSNWRYLKGTTPVSQRVSEVNGCASVCPVSLWTSEEMDADLAFDFSTLHPDQKDPRGAGKDWKMAVVCVGDEGGR